MLRHFDFGRGDLLILTAVVVWAIQLRSASPRTTYLQGLAATAPVVGLMGCVYVVMNGFLGISNVRPEPSLTIVAPGIVEALLILGLLAIMSASFGASLTLPGIAGFVLT